MGREIKGKRETERKRKSKREIMMNVQKGRKETRRERE